MKKTLFRLIKKTLFQTNMDVERMEHITVFFVIHTTWTHVRWMYITVITMKSIETDPKSPLVLDMACQKAHFEKQILDLNNKISNLKSLKPSKNNDNLFQQIMSTCLPTETNIDVEKLCPKVQNIRTSLIKLRSEAIGYSEQHYFTVLGSLEDNPLHHLYISTPAYYTNYLKLSKVEVESQPRSRSWAPVRCPSHPSS